MTQIETKAMRGSEPGAVCLRLMLQSIFRATRFLQKRVSFKLADIGEGISEVQIIQWYVKEGNSIKQFDKIAEVQSDKATVEITSRYDGKVSKLHYNLNDMAKVGEPLIDIETDEKTDLKSKSLSKEIESMKPISESEVKATKQLEDTGDYLMLPSVRKYIRENEINLDSLSGLLIKKGQVLTKEDIKEAIDSAKCGQDLNQFYEHKMNPVQKAMTRAMEQSLKIPHFGYNDEYGMDNLAKVRSIFKIKVSPLTLIIKALDLAVKDFPIINSHYKDGVVLCSNILNLGIAIDTPQGLVVPVLKKVNEIESIEEIASKLIDLTERARKNKLNQEDFDGATLTISNVGTIGGTYTSPIIVPPQVCIGAIGKIRTVPSYKEGSELVVPRKIACFSWSADHRVVDGATMARFSNRVKEIIEADVQSTQLK